MWSLEHRGAGAGAGTPIRRLLQESRKGKAVCPRAGAERVMRHGQVVRFYQKGKEEQEIGNLFEK